MLSAFSATGSRAASTRTRLVSWLERMHTEWEWFNYLGLESYGVGDVASRPGPISAAEIRLLSQSAERLERAFIHREVSPVSAGVQEALIRWRSQHLAFDLDDAIYVGGNSRLTRLRTGKFTRMATSADVVIAANERLADWASKFSTDVRIIPTCVDLSDYTLAASKEELEVLSCAVVWLGSPSGEEFLEVVSRPLARFLRETGVRLHVISSGRKHLGELEPFTDRVEWTIDVQGHLGGYLFAIAPLPVTEFTLGKSAYKLIQYGAAGLPFVASPVGANAVVAGEVGGLVARTEQDWFEAFRYLYSMSEITRGQLGAQMQREVQSRYSYASWRNDWLAAVGL